MVTVDPTHLDTALSPWSTDWAWGLPLIVLTVITHVIGLQFINQKVAPAATTLRKYFHSGPVFASVMGITTLSVTFLHGIEAAIWGAAYLSLGALPDKGSAMLYSLNAITSYGHENLHLQPHWHLMGAVESLNGWLLFGLSTAFLFSTIEKFRVLEP